MIGIIASSVYYGEQSPKEPSIAPVVSGYSLTVYQLDYVNFKIQSTGDPTSYTASALPLSLVFDSSTGVISGSISRSTAPGQYTITISATDAFGTGYAYFVLTVLELRG